MIGFVEWFRKQGCKTLGVSKKRQIQHGRFAGNHEDPARPGGCPWDREQTHQSIRNCFIEETYEAVEAIDTEDPVLLQEELGDVLLQVLFHSEIEEEEGRFDFSDVVDGKRKRWWNAIRTCSVP